MPTSSRLDHAVVNVRFDLDGAQTLFESLGFTLTPRGYHSLGSQNHLMMFADDYLELIAVPRGQQIERQDLVDAPLGINGIVFAADDVDEVFARLQRLGFAGEPPRAFHRPVTVDGSEQQARFRTVTVRSDVFPAGRVYFCEHLTPELVWRPEWQHQSNGVCSIVEVVTVTGDVPAEAERFADLLDAEVEVDVDRHGGGVVFNGCRLTVLSPQKYEDRYGPLASDLAGRPSIFGALVLATTNRGAIHNEAESAEGVVTAELTDQTDQTDRTLVRLGNYDALLEFVDAPDAR